MSGVSIDSTTELTNNYYQNVKYPIYSYGASPSISHSDFFITDDDASVGYGQPAIWLMTSTVDMEYCNINNYKTGLKVDHFSHVDISMSEFYADSVTPGIVADTIEFINIAIEGVGFLSTCKIRNTCFISSYDKYIYRSQTAFDLGTASDDGLNSFFFTEYCKLEVCPYYDHPSLAIENIPTSTLYAMGNIWESSNWNKFSPTSTIDTSGALIGEQSRCDLDVVYTKL